MNVLMISSDINFFKESQGDVWERHLAYARTCQKLIIIVKAGDKEGCKIAQKGNVVAIPSGGSNPLFIFFKLFIRSSELIKKERIDLVNTQDPMVYGLVGYFLKLIHKVPLIVNWHGDYLYNPDFIKEKRFNNLLLHIARFVSKRADRVRAVSSKIKEKLVLEGVDRDKIIVINTAVNTQNFSNPDSAFTALLQKKYEGRKPVIAVGRLVFLKNLDFFINLFPRVLDAVPQACLLIIGAGEARGEWEQLAQKLGISGRVEFLGSVAHSELSSYYRISFLHIFPSKHESFGKVILEATAAGTVTLASRTTGSETIIKSQDLLFGQGNAEECLEKTIRLLRDEQHRNQELASLQKDIEENFSWKKSVEAVQKMWEEVG